MNRLQLAIIVASIGLLEACASTLQAKPEQQAEFLNDQAEHGVASEAVVPHVHAHTKINWAAYDKVELRPIIVSHELSTELSRKDEEELNELVNVFYELLSQRLSQDYVLVDQPTSGAILMEVAITHAERSWIAPQFLSKVSWQLQALNSLARYFRGKPAFAGEVTIQFTVHDSLTGELLFAGIDRRVGGQNLFDKEVFNSWGDVQNSLEFWTEQSAYQLCLARRGSNCSPPKA
jgi:hypothetical protein